ncbi:delta-like protein 1 isoform X1 [Microplitis mediator]|uniref:delta-like protein 1 isoform X1 n=1 Tax=Microplitis mediator TaxID=375433 RepID=UPI00255342AE|nr:delta-like protein 1 isoform X1 [Microplitis mediator]
MILVLAYLLPLFLGASHLAIAPGYNSVSLGFGFITTLGLGAFPLGFAAGPRWSSRYVPKWKKQACEIPAAQHPGSHYVCDEAGEVKCLPGWTGDLCDVPLCRKGCDPLQGYCRRPGECRCKLGFYGELCDKCVALPGCQHGRCNVSFECACDPGWKGLFCSEPICDSDCHPSQGYCEKPGECRCRLGWQGNKCKQCSVLPGCVHGTCQGPLECRCKPGWTGIVCQTPICAPGCSRENGGCRRPGTCRCRVGWTGANCTECVPYPGCVNGSCRRPWECRCQPGWTGDLCDEKLTFCDDHPDICQNNATCVSMTKEDGDYRCICPIGYTGRKCQIETVEPAAELMPPKLENVEMSNTSTESSVEQVTNKINSTTSISMVNSHQGHWDFEQVTEKIQGTTIEPLGPIVITDPPSTVDPAATAGKWPIELESENPLIDSEIDNET